MYSDYSCRYDAQTYEELFISNPANYGGERTNVVKCFMTEFREWVLTDTKASPSDTDIAQALEDYNLTEIWSVSDFDACAFDNSFPVEGQLCFLYLYLVTWLNEDLPTMSPDYVLAPATTSIGRSRRTTCGWRSSTRATRRTRWATLCRTIDKHKHALARRR